MNPNIDFLGICQLLKALRTVGFSETEIKKIARRIAVELGANFTLYACFLSVLVIAITPLVW